MGQVTPNLSSAVIPIDPPRFDTVGEDTPISWTLVGERLFILPTDDEHLQIGRNESYIAGGGATAHLPKHSISRYNISFLAEGNAGDWIGFRSVIAINDGTVAKDRWQVVKYKQFPKGTRTNICTGR